MEENSPKRAKAPIPVGRKLQAPPSPEIQKKPVQRKGRSGTISTCHFTRPPSRGFMITGYEPNSDQDDLVQITRTPGNFRNKPEIPKVPKQFNRINPGRERASTIRSFKISSSNNSFQDQKTKTIVIQNATQVPTNQAPLKPKKRTLSHHALQSITGEPPAVSETRVVRQKPRAMPSINKQDRYQELYEIFDITMQNRISIDFHCKPSPLQITPGSCLEEKFDDDLDNNDIDYSDLSFPIITEQNQEKPLCPCHLNTKLLEFAASKASHRHRSHHIHVDENPQKERRKSNTVTVQPNKHRSSTISPVITKQFNPNLFFQNSNFISQDMLKEPFSVLWDGSETGDSISSSITIPNTRVDYLKLFSPNNLKPQESLPVSYVPYLTYQNLLNQTIKLDLTSLETMESLISALPQNPLLDLVDTEKERDKSPEMEVVFGDRFWRIPLSDTKTVYSLPNKNAFGESQTELKDFPFVSPDFFPVNFEDTNLNTILFPNEFNELESKPTIREKLRFLYATAVKRQKRRIFYPFKIFNDVPIFACNLRKKGKKSFTYAYILASGKFVFDTKEINLSLRTHASMVDSTSFKLYEDDRTVGTFVAENDSCAAVWVRQINDTSTSENTSILDLFLFTLSSITPSISIENQMIECIISPYILFTVTLLNHQKIGFEKGNMIFNILLSNGRLDFFVRSIINAEISLVPFSQLFTCKTRYTISLLSLFVSAASKWLSILISNIVYNEIVNGLDLLTIIYSLFSLIDDKSIYILRCLLLHLIALCPKNRHPLIPFFRFLKVALCPFLRMSFDASKFSHEPAFDNLEVLIKAPMIPPYSRVILELVPFARKVINHIPHMNGYKEITKIQARELYLFMVANIRDFLEAFREFLEMDDSKHPIMFSYYQNIKILFMNFFNDE
ncbi:hypothetical protein GPJ56_008675 [Histomonas meleagridis]|uniref:uncharacterized protein n=1 Tax=Histomonas meleagridis TaxID=135588 RepID=UPI00355ACA34|nr:hypothetical protein GPJ56_008675 [Histomonas meleagridis]KAH0805747.1 hypothetical protein GO595_001386 [Histomonas meleagridis]